MFSFLDNYNTQNNDEADNPQSRNNIFGANLLGDSGNEVQGEINKIKIKKVDGTFDEYSIGDGGSGDYINVVEEGISSNGDIDIGAAINSLITDNPGRTFYFPKGRYLVNTTIDLGTNGIMLVCDSGAEFFATEGIQYLLKIGSGQRPTNLLKTGIVGGTFIGTNVNTSCMFVSDLCYSAVIQDVLIKDIETIGIKVCNNTSTSSQVYMQNITIIGKLNTVATATGILLFGTDNYLNIINIGRCKKGLIFGGGGNLCTNVHVWNNPTYEMPRDKESLQEFQSIRNNGDNRIVNLHIDNPYIGIMCTVNNVRMIVTSAVFNYDIDMTDIATEENNACMLWYTVDYTTASRSSYNISNVSITGLRDPSIRGYFRSVVESDFLPSTDATIRNHLYRKFEYVGQREALYSLPLHDELNNVCTYYGNYPIQNNYTVTPDPDSYYLIGYVGNFVGYCDAVLAGVSGKCEIEIKVDTNNELSVKQKNTDKFGGNKILVFSKDPVTIDGKSYFPIYIKYRNNNTDYTPLYIKILANTLNGLYFRRYQNIILNDTVNEVTNRIEIDLYKDLNDYAIYETPIELYGHEDPNNGVIIGTADNLRELARAEKLKSIYKIGSNALAGHPSNKATGDVIAIGTEVMSKNFVGAHNIGIGSYALNNLKGDTVNYNYNGAGDRNIAIGSLAYLFGENIRCNVGIGRDVAQNLVSGGYNTNVGYATIGGFAHIGLDGKIKNYTPITLNKVTTLGALAMRDSNSAGNTIAIGAYCAPYVKNAQQNVFVGSNALEFLGKDISYNGKKYAASTDEGTYSVNSDGTTINVQIPNHKAVSNNYVEIKFTSGDLTSKTTESQILYVIDVDEDNFTLNTDCENLTGTGTCKILGYETEDDVSDYRVSENIVIGSSAGAAVERIDDSTLIGFRVLQKAKKIFYTTAVGRNIGYDNLLESYNNTLIGNGVASAPNLTVLNESVGVGTGALSAFSSSTQNTAIGASAGRYMVDGTTGTGIVTNATCIGYNSRVSGDNEIQLGNGNATPYAYHSLQIRSDERDKCEIKDNPLGLDFINSLRPVQYKTNFRDLYEDFDNSSEEFKGTRFHNGFIAQEVKEVADKFDIDFAGYQDHTLNGGCDVQSLSYGELIAPMVKAIQELSEQVKILQEKS